MKIINEEKEDIKLQQKINFYIMREKWQEFLYKRKYKIEDGLYISLGISRTTFESYINGKDMKKNVKTDRKIALTSGIRLEVIQGKEALSSSNCEISLERWKNFFIDREGAIVNKNEKIIENIKNHSFWNSKCYNEARYARFVYERSLFIMEHIKNIKEHKKDNKDLKDIFKVSNNSFPI